MAEWTDERPVVLRLDDAWSARAALQRWADQCVPGSDRALREIIARINDAIDIGMKK